MWSKDDLKAIVEGRCRGQGGASRALLYARYLGLTDEPEADKAEAKR